MQEAIRREDVLFRLGSDEFIFGFIPNGKIDASIGIALFLKDGENIETLISKADSAMYQAKRERTTCSEHTMSNYTV